MHGPIAIDAAQARAALDFPTLIAALREAFVAGAEVPLRGRHTLRHPGAADATLLLMPAWRGRGMAGVKIVSVFPENGTLGLPAVSSTYLLMDGATGRHLAVIDGSTITDRRTVAASALAGDFLARPDAETLLVVGSGQVASLLPDAWSTVRPIRRVRVWNRRPEGAQELAATLRRSGHDAAPVTDLETAVRGADIVSCATLSTTPLVRGAWLRPGTHLDLIGAYRPDMRETDDAAVRRAGIWIDTDAALVEGGDLTQAFAGAVPPDAIRGSLSTLCRGQSPGRGTAEEITLFKSVGSAIEDLAAAALVWAAASG